MANNVFIYYETFKGPCLYMYTYKKNITKNFSKFIKKKMKNQKKHNFLFTKKWDYHIFVKAKLILF